MPARKRKRNPTDYIDIKGLQDFAEDMGILPSQMAAADQLFRHTASRAVVERAKNLARQGDRMQASSADEVRAGAPGTVVYGGKGYSMGAEFGAYKYKQFQTWRGNKDEAGYFLWPAIRIFRDREMQKLWIEKVWSVAGQYFND